ncbi:hypothetical protein [Maridesulfovibrio frigidus]|uniref:hypothetical protein n=1 Tax=Maridesulfovibrio frigidus TaxID=340956 RepID=UPI0004E16497|nr:hypothetical protein [Maridesulfovibrio frigidus]
MFSGREWILAVFLVLLSSTICYGEEEPLYIKNIPSPGMKTLGQKNKGWSFLDMMERSFKIDTERFNGKHSFGEVMAREMSINVGYTTAVAATEQANSNGDSPKDIVKQTVTETIGFNGLSPYYGRVTFYQYLDSNYQQGYEPDFSYSFGVANYAPDTLSIEYSNYGGNRLSPKVGEEFTDLNQGTITTTYRFEVPESIVRFLHPDDEARFLGWASYNLTPEYQQGRWWKQWFGLGVSVPIWNNVSLWAQGNLYPDSSQTTAGDPDFTYGFGYYDWSPGGFILAFSSYAPNGFPWGDSNKKGDFMDGSVFFGYNLDLESIWNFFAGKPSLTKSKPSKARPPWGPGYMEW